MKEDGESDDKIR